MLSWLVVGVTGFLLVELGPCEAPCYFERQFLLERHYVLVLREPSLACG